MMESWLADMHARADENERALSIVEMALTNVGSGRSWEAELHRQRGLLLGALNSSNVEEVESHLTKAIETARSQNAKSLELRAVTSLSELWRTQGKSAEARALLEPVLHSFEEGTDTVDLIRGRNALGDLN